MAQKNNYGTVAFSLSIVALSLAQTLIVLISYIYSFINAGWNNLLAGLFTFTLLAGPMVMGIIATNMIKRAQNTPRAFIVLTRIFSILAIVIGAIILFYYFIVFLFTGTFYY